MPKKVEKRGHAEAFPEQDQDQQENVEEKDTAGSNAVIVLHPGSSLLHLGLSTDHTPQSIPHIIAYRNHSSDGSRDQLSHPLSRDGSRDQMPHPVARDPTLILQHETEITPDLEGQRESGLVEIRRALAACRSSLGVAEGTVGVEKYATHNSRVQPVARESDDLSLTDLTANPKVVIGNEVLYLPPDSNYTIMKPIRHGKLNVGPHCSLSCVLSQLEDLWTKAIEDYLDVPRRDFKFYRAILLIPDVVDRETMKEFVNILLLRMEFAAAFLHQASVCAMYSAGLSTACVVNVGDEVTHVCCVEDGMSNPNTRVTLHYGGSDITRLLYWLLKQANIPYKECSADNRLDGVLVQQLKESVCHLDPTLHGIGDNEFTVMTKTPGVLHDYEMKLADEVLYAPMGVFFPSAFCLPDDCVLMEGQDTPVPVPDDLYDEGNWTEGQGQPMKTTAKSASSTGITTEQQSSENGISYEATKRLSLVPPGKILGLDQAIHFSIDCASSLEMKKKLYSSILLIGGGLAFQGAASILQSRLELKRPPTFTRGTDSIEVFSNPRDLESNMVGWRGGAVLRCLDTCQELWIEHQEWEFTGVRLLRERAPFQW